MLLMTIKHLIVAYTMGKYSGSKAGEERAQRTSFQQGLPGAACASEFRTSLDSREKQDNTALDSLEETT
jgi:hypothetical protein